MALLEGKTFPYVPSMAGICGPICGRQSRDCVRRSRGADSTEDNGEASMMMHDCSLRVVFGTWAAKHGGCSGCSECGPEQLIPVGQRNRPRRGTGPPKDVNKSVPGAVGEGIAILRQAARRKGRRTSGLSSSPSPPKSRVGAVHSVSGRKTGTGDRGSKSWRNAKVICTLHPKKERVKLA